MMAYNADTLTSNHQTLPMQALSQAQAESLLAQYWGIHAHASPLPSYADQNFRMREQGTGAEYVFKIANPDFAAADLLLENAVMRHLAISLPQLGLPRVIVTGDGADLLPLPMDDGSLAHMRLLSFVPGITYANAIADISVQRESLHYSLGQTMASLARGLADFQHPNANRAQAWNLLQLPQLQDAVSLLDDAVLRNCVAQQMASLQRALPHWQNTLPCSMIHNDANDLNLIVAEQKIAALIDFGDACYSLRIADLAIACVYAMLYEAEPIACASQIVRGYLAELPLTEAELAALLPCIRGRLCHSILMAERARRAQPDNAIILFSQRDVRRLLPQLCALDDAAISHHFLSLLPV